MADQSLIARLRGYIGKASFATEVDRYAVTTLLDELAAALAREQEAQPAAQEPSEAEIARLADLHGVVGTARGIKAHEQRVAFARAILASQPPSAQEPITERAEPQGLTDEALRAIVAGITKEEIDGALLAQALPMWRKFATNILAARATAGSKP